MIRPAAVKPLMLAALNLVAAPVKGTAAAEEEAEPALVLLLLLVVELVIAAAVAAEPASLLWARELPLLEV